MVSITILIYKSNDQIILKLKPYNIPIPIAHPIHLQHIRDSMELITGNYKNEWLLILKKSLHSS